MTGRDRTLWTFHGSMMVRWTARGIEVETTPLGGGTVASWLVDTGTGRTLLTLAGWTARGSSTGPPVFYRSDALARRLWVAVLDPGRSALRVLGSVPEPDGDTAGCTTAGRYLVCRTVKDAVQVWRIGVPG